MEKEKNGAAQTAREHIDSLEAQEKKEEQRRTRRVNEAQVFRRVLRVLTPAEKRRMLGLFFMMLIGAALETVGTSLILPLIEVAMAPGEALGRRRYRMIYELLQLRSVNSFLLLMIVSLMVIYLIKNVFLYVMYLMQNRFVYQGMYRTSRTVFKDFVSRDYEFFLDASTPLTIRHIASDVNGVYNLVRTYLSLFTDIIIFAALFAVSLFMSPTMTGVMILVIGLILAVNKIIISPVSRRWGHEANVNNALVTKWLMQAINGIKETKVLNREKYFIDQYDRSGKKLAEIQTQSASVANLPRLSIETMTMVGILAMMGIFIGRTDNAAPMMARIGVLAVVAIRIMPSANRIAQSLNSVAYYEPSLTAVETIITDSRAANVDARFEGRDEIRPLSFSDHVELRDISYRYPGTETDILKDSSLTIPIGHSIGLVGPSGAGKSTAVDIILGLLKPQEGQILVDGRIDIEENLPGWYADIGYVPQMMFMLDDTIRSNVAYGVRPEDIDDAKVWHVLEEAKLDEFVRSLPDGLNTGIGERGVRISGGQRQRIGIARALYNDPQIMIFDEATSALDNETEKAIMEAIERLHGRKTLIIVAHRLSTIANCDAVYRVENQKFNRLTKEELLELIRQQRREA
ncbi:ABC transporter ATP-binding protein [Lachnoclostridium sp. Marseille-P6806]|uniref:ABC transporter ATP-binding protein n=1 Tax=Lachnoclostridium sp. Marseille-P6806 TaxID=2364793 RepID=UPI001030552F|nr:ABC transporter ATP-binding protein [Lachnoclostridium sp. Marseille-P6806]